jgi:hypothetical protein
MRSFGARYPLLDLGDGPRMWHVDVPDAPHSTAAVKAARTAADLRGFDVRDVVGAKRNGAGVFVVTMIVRAAK